jgi:hypothetical protein
MENNKKYSVRAQSFQTIETPQIKEVRGKEYMYYGKKNLFPEELIRLYDTSAMHHTCIQAIKDGIFGEGISTFGTEYVNTKGETMDDIFEKISLDYSLYQGYALNVIWNKGGDRIAEIYHLPFNNVRSGIPNTETDEVEEYFYSGDWNQLKKYPFKNYKAFDITQTKGENSSQIFYVHEYTPGNSVYPLPAYVGAIQDIELDARVSKFHNSNIENGISPSLFLQFSNGVPTDEEQKQIYDDINATFSGEENAGRFFLNFSDGSDRGLTVTPIDSANDDYYITLEGRISSRILTAHRISSPLLLGIKDAAGFSSNADEMRVAYAHFESTVCAPKRKKILTPYGYILKLAGWNVSLTVEPKKIIIEDTTVNETETNTI